MAKRISLLGSTGSIGRQTLDIVRALPEHFNVIGLAAGRNIELFTRQVEEFRPRYVSLAPAENGEAARRRLTARGCEFLSLEEMACLPGADTVVVATSGTAALGATLAAARTGRQIALANKESLVVAGEMVMNAARNSGACILPVDSEHSAVWQCLAGERQAPRRIILIASGGPFRDCSEAEMEGITPERALRHPSWQMGPKVTIDSATLMNKGLEVIEAHWLFNMPFENITVLVHPRSIVHSMVEFIDGSVKAQLSQPDMRLPIQYALSYPERIANNDLPAIDWVNFADLTFKPPDIERFPCLRLAVESGRKGGTWPAALCAADEAAVELFLAGRIRFTDIARIVESTLERHRGVASPSIEEIIAAGEAARRTAIDIAGVLLK
jgi:1-deoxy-D-xylulose-5-phosphate reductoisomerase